MESWVQSWQPRTNAFCDFSSPPVESIAPATKKWCQVMRSAAPVTQNHLSKPEDLLLQNATRLRKSAPSPPNSSDEGRCLLYCDCHGKCIFADPLQMSRACHSFWKWYKALTFCSLWTRCTIPCACHAKRDLNVQKWSVHGVFCDFDFEMCFAPQRHALFRHLNFQKWSGAGVFCTFWLGNVLRATTACTFSTSQLPKVVRTWCVLYILTWKRASRHNGVHFFDISTSKSGPNLVCFVHFDLEMCFAPQQRALFRHLNFQKWSEPGVFCTFWLGNVLRATTACNFSSLIWAAGSAPAALASLLFNPPEPQIIGNTPCFATFLPFRASASSFFWLFLFSDLLSSTLLFSLTLPISAFHLSILSEVWLLNFLRWRTLNI